jgi:hypothetical protein
VRGAFASPDGQFIVVRSEDGYRQFAAHDGTSQIVPGLTPNDVVIRYSPDGKSLWTRQAFSMPVQIEQVDLKTGARSKLIPPFGMRRAGVTGIVEVSLADDPRTFAYMERESASYLFELKKMQ